MIQPRCNHEALLRFARDLLVEAGMDAEKSSAMADVLVESDLQGHDTHGLAQLALCLADVESGGTAKSGEPSIVSDRPAAMAWDGMRLPGPWLHPSRRGSAFLE